MIEIKNSNYGTITLGIDYFESIIAELNQRRATMSALANILEVTQVPKKSLIKILREDSNHVR